MGRAMRGDDDDPQAETQLVTADSEQFVNAAVTVPAGGLGEFYQAVADWWQGYEARRGRAMRGGDEAGGG